MNFNQVLGYNIYELKMNDISIKVQWQFIKYSDWSKGKINPLKNKITPINDKGSVIFPPNIEGFDLLKR